MHFLFETGGGATPKSIYSRATVRPPESVFELEGISRTESESTPDEFNGVSVRDGLTSL